MKALSMYLLIGCAACAIDAADLTPPPVVQAPPPATPATQPPAAPAPPPSAPAKRSAAELEKLLGPIALYPDPLIATILPASVYPLEIVQAARFVANTNNLAKLDEQPWDENVKAVARVPAVIKQMNDDLAWTVELGDAFLAQDKDVMDTIQSLRGKAQKAGTLQTTPQQVVVVTNVVSEKTVEQQVVVVTNTVVQIQPSNPQVVYVPTYSPATVYYPPPAYYANPYPLLTFGAGMAMGAIIANNCDWHGGGCYHSDVNVNVNQNFNQNVNANRNANVNTGRGSGANQTGAAGSQKKWQPDQSRLGKSGSPTAANSARGTEARGWGSGGAGPSTGSVGARPSTGTAGARPSAGTAGTRPSTGTAAARPSTGSAGARPSTGATAGSRPSASSSASRPSPSASASRPSASPSASRSGGSAFGGTSSGSSAFSSSSRGASSRGGGFSGGGGRGGGGRGR